MNRTCFCLDDFHPVPVSVVLRIKIRLYTVVQGLKKTDFYIGAFHIPLFRVKTPFTFIIAGITFIYPISFQKLRTKIRLPLNL